MHCLLFSGGLLFTRKMRRSKFREGALSGDELKQLRQEGKPVLCVFLDIGRQYKGISRPAPYPHDFVYPSLVLPDIEQMPAHVFNLTH